MPVGIRERERERGRDGQLTSEIKKKNLEGGAEIIVHVLFHHN